VPGAAADLSVEVTAAVLGAALLHASWNALVKSSPDKQLDSIAVATTSGLIALITAPWLDAPAPESWPWLAGSALVHILYFVCIAGAYRWGELSYAYPIMRGGGPLIVALVAVFALGEALPSSQWIGVVLISSGSLGLAAGAHDRRATLFAVANAVVIAAYTLIDAQGARLSGAPVSYTLWFFAANGFVIFALAALWRGRAVPLYLARHWARTGLGGLLAVGAYGVALWAMTRAPVALVAALRETSVIFAALIGALFLGEKMTRRRLAATGAVLTGLIFLKL
jgi:drug/metabolite transporter (DMT)-like permease